ncbi:pantoate--beta-alanine ligase [Paenibacillus baekrokdamisoli]|uniref:Pantothenate synthetase n=1 Tax=Paenibacillus baekrokdamisoli TaxID=1712516 RepID=A0A3G9IXS3_9BACL|nr:pantoate--beta-alanine ligase [Paenibacillus baekrokdamisoli]MBB3069691.1 pantoate--beta-alanine ligase [Paenibacillus baekrokdamisoli]BBH20955.1 pantoate--beta-alanine ligase [Paenibacillus baekrokdamisoli]
MIVCTTITELKAQLLKQRRSVPEGRIGLIPTMGFLHAGHASLMRRANEECEYTILSIFVNPLQFGPNEDFDRYPRDSERDIALAEANHIDVVFMPTVHEMYPKTPFTKVLVSTVTDRLCGASRPGHFDGVGTVVSKLFHLIMPDCAYFGMKDAQQVAVIKRMVDDLNFPVEIVPCETIREADGLAMSSRNVYLNEEQRNQAVVLSQTLLAADDWLKEPGITAAELASRINSKIREASLAEIDYAEVLEYPDLTLPEQGVDLSRHESTLIVALAVKFGQTRLIDNRLMVPFGGDRHVQNDDEIQAASGNRNRS